MKSVPHFQLTIAVVCALPRINEGLTNVYYAVNLQG